MAQFNTIGQGPGNLAPDKEFKSYLAAGAISKGDLVTYSGATGYTVDVSGANGLVIGVAAEDIASGAWGKIQTAGFCDYITTDGTVAADQLLVSDANGAADGVAVSVTTFNYVFGVALAADVSTVLSAAIIYKRF